jgi:hypothetical protein
MIRKEVEIKQKEELYYTTGKGNFQAKMVSNKTQLV